MNLDIRSQMAVNLCAGLNVSMEEKFLTLAGICKKWGFGAKESFPLACSLRDKLGLTTHGVTQKMRAVVDGMEVSLHKRN